VSARDKLLRPLKMMGSVLDVKLGVLVSARVDVSGGRTVGYDNRVSALNGFIGDGFGEVNGKEGRVHLATDGVEGRFEKD
jgi:hypothetical protein